MLFVLAGVYCFPFFRMCMYLHLRYVNSKHSQTTIQLLMLNATCMSLFSWQFESSGSFYAASTPQAERVRNTEMFVNGGKSCRYRNLAVILRFRYFS